MKRNIDDTKRILEIFQEFRGKGIHFEREYIGKGELNAKNGYEERENRSTKRDD